MHYFAETFSFVLKLAYSTVIPLIAFCNNDEASITVSADLGYAEYKAELTASETVVPATKSHNADPT